MGRPAHTDAMPRGGPPVQPAWGRTIQQRREARDWSIRWAARQAGLSDVFWAQMERGYKKEKSGAYVDVTPSLGSLLQAAAALRLDAREVDGLVQAAGYDPLPKRYVDGTQPVSTAEAIENDPDLSERARRHLLDQYDMLRSLSLLEPAKHAPGDLPPSGPEDESIEQRRERLRVEHTARAQRMGRDAARGNGGVEEVPRRAAGGGGGRGGVGGRPGGVRP